MTGVRRLYVAPVGPIRGERNLECKAAGNQRFVRHFRGAVL